MRCRIIGINQEEFARLKCQKYVDIEHIVENYYECYFYDIFHNLVGNQVYKVVDQMVFNILMTLEEYITYIHRGDMLTGIIIILIMIIYVVIYFIGKGK